MDLTTIATSLNTSTILPELIVILTLVVVLIADLVSRRSTKSLTALSVVGLAGSVVAVGWQWLHTSNTLAFLGALTAIG